jgi:leader peptidase (prepilin peptidase)/N-methyltransferase
VSVTVTVLAAIFGGAAAAFVPRLAHRLAVPFGTPSRSTCAECTADLPTWVRVGAPCPCQRPPLWTVTAGALVTGILATTIGPAPLLVVVLLATPLGILLATIDIRCLRLPDRLVALLAVVTVLPLSFGAAVTGGPDLLVRPTLAALAGGTWFLVFFLLPGSPVGGGDVKLAVVLCFVLGFLGWPAVVTGLLTAHTIGGLIALSLLITRRAHRRTPLPMGPLLLAGSVLGLLSA